MVNIDQNRQMKLDITASEKELFDTIQSAADILHEEVFVVGGFVRDRLLGIPCKDIDFVTPGDGPALAEEVNRLLGYKASELQVFKTFGTAMIRYRDMELEFVGARKESYSSNSRKPSVEQGTLRDDQLRRDFTINALAVSLQGENAFEIIDPFDGLTDLHKKRLVTPLDPQSTFSDDPLRMMRAIRFASQLSFQIDPVTLDAITAMRDRITIVSMERVSYELNKIILSPVPSVGFMLLDKTGLLKIIFPELHAMKGVDQHEGYGHKDNFYHTLQVLDNVAENSSDLWLRWSAILHDIAKPVTKRFEPGHGWTFHGHEVVGANMTSRIFRRMKLPLDEKMKYVQQLVRLHLRPIALVQEEITDSAIRRLLFDAGDDLDDLMLLCKADITSKNPERVARYLGNYTVVIERLREVEELDHFRNWQPPITGQIIMDTFGIKPGRIVGEIKTAIREAILDGKLESDYDQAYAFMLLEGARHGLVPE
jgi:putative nucleotidyltransferase with HDIG domain